MYESAGMLGSLLACSLEALVIDNDMLGSVNRTVRGIDITEESLSAQVIKDTITGAGHFPGHISSEQDEWIRANYPIALPVEEVRGDGGC